MLVTALKIEATETFINLKDSIQKKLTLKHENIKLIQYGVNVSNNVGFDRWLEISHPMDRTRDIVKELLSINQENIIVIDPVYVNELKSF